MSESAKRSGGRGARATDARGGPRISVFAATVILTAITLALYANAVGNAFMFDDLAVIVRDLRVTEGQYGRLWTEQYWGEGHRDLLYRPLVSVSFAINWAISNHPAAFRIPNLLLHIGVCVLVFVLTRDLFGRWSSVAHSDGVGQAFGDWAAIVAAVVFAVHPVHTEPLNTIVGRSDLAVTLFMLAAAWLWWRDAGADGPGGPSHCTGATGTEARPTAGTEARPTAGLGRPLLAALCFAAAMLCKESGITLIGIIVVLDWWYGRRLRNSTSHDATPATRGPGVASGANSGAGVASGANSGPGVPARSGPGVSARPAGWWRRRIVRCYAPMFAVAVGYLTLRYAVLGALTSLDIDVPDAPAGVEILTREYENPIDTPPEALPEGTSRALVRWGTPVATFGKAATMMLVPVPLRHDYSIPAYPPVTDAMEARFWIGIAWVLAVVVGGFASWRRGGAGLVAMAFALIPYSIVSNIVVLIGTIFGERLLYGPSVGVCMLIGLFAARPLSRMTLATKSPAVDQRGIVVAVILIGISAWYAYTTVDRNRDWRSAEALLASVPDDGSASFKVLDAYADREIIAARALRESGDTEGADAALARAIEYARRSYAAAPKAWGSTSRLGIALRMQGREREAMRALQEALRKGAGIHEPTLLHAADLSAELGDWSSNRVCLTHLVRLRPRHPGYRNNLAVACLRMEDAEEAVEHATIAHKLAPDVAGIRETLARALLSSGAPTEALPHARAAAEGLPAIGEAQLTLVRVLDVLGQAEDAKRAACAAIQRLADGAPERPELERRCAADAP